MSVPEHYHLCPVTACPRRIPRHLLMCKGHWLQVPRELRRDVLKYWRDGDGLGNPAYWEAREAAIAFHNGEER